MVDGAFTLALGANCSLPRMIFVAKDVYQSSAVATRLNDLFNGRDAGMVREELLDEVGDLLANIAKLQSHPAFDLAEPAEFRMASVLPRGAVFHQPNLGE